MSMSETVTRTSTVTWATWEQKKEVKEREYWISSLIRENSMSFVINQAETFNSKTNYGVANASHLTRAYPPSRTGHFHEVNRRREKKKRVEGRTSRAENECMTDMIVQTGLCLCLWRKKQRGRYQKTPRLSTMINNTLYRNKEVQACQCSVPLHYLQSLLTWSRNRDMVLDTPLVIQPR